MGFTKLNSFLASAPPHAVSFSFSIAPFVHSADARLNPILIENVTTPSNLRDQAPTWSYPRRRSTVWEAHVTLFSRAFVRRRVISLATTLSVAATSFALAQDPKAMLHLRSAAKQAEEQQFLFANDLAISNTSREMLVTPTGDIDRDFAAIMIPQHRGAIDMAEAELKYGHNDELRGLAEKIVTQQQQEISILRRAAGEVAATSAPSAEH